MFLPLFPTRQTRTVSRSMFWHRNTCFFCDSLVKAGKHDREVPARCGVAWLCPWATTLLRTVTVRRAELSCAAAFASSIFICPSFWIIRPWERRRGLQHCQLCRPYGWNVCGSRQDEHQLSLCHRALQKQKRLPRSRFNSWINVLFPWLWPGQGLSCAWCLQFHRHFVCTIINNAIHKCQVH